MSVNSIHIIKSKGTPIEENQEIETDSYFLIYMDRGRAKFTGDFDFRSFGPLLPDILKFIADKFVQTGKAGTK